MQSNDNPFTNYSGPSSTGGGLTGGGLTGGLHTGAGDSVAPASIPAPQTKKSNTGKIVLGAAGGCLSIVVFGCLFTGFLAYDGGTDFSAEPFTVESDLFVDELGREAIRVQVQGGPEHVEYSVNGPSSELGEQCSDMGGFFSQPPLPACTIPLTSAPSGDLSYSVVARGEPKSWFGAFPFGDMPEHTEEFTLSRPYGFLWAQGREATICTGATCILGFAGGEVQLTGAPLGTQVEHNGRMGASVPVDLVALVDQTGLQQVLTAQEGRTALNDVRVILPSGGAVTGEVGIPVPGLRTSWFAAFAEMAAEGTAPVVQNAGTASLWIDNGNLRETAGSPASTTDLARVVVQQSERRDSARCGPYIGGLYQQRSYLRRVRTDTTVSVINRTNGSVSRRRFRGSTPRCPQTIQGQTSISGEASTAATEYARTQLTAG